MNKVAILGSFLLVITASLSLKAQKGVFRYGYKEWTDYMPSIRLGIGTQSSVYTEVGFSRLKYIYNDLGYAATAHYVALEWAPSTSVQMKNVFGLKAGWEANLRTLALGIEGKYQTNSINNDFLITPKIGFGVFGVVNLFYGYNISLSGVNFSGIGNNQFSVVCNLNGKIMKGDKK